MIPALKKMFDDRDNDSFEVKSGEAKVTTIAKLVCGMLNSQGGTVMLGFSKNADFEGVSEPDEKVCQINSYVAEHVSPLPLFSVSTHTVDNKTAIMVEVPQGADKPYAFDRAIFVRVGKQTLKASSDTAADIVNAQARQLARWESGPLPGFEISDCDDQELLSAKHEIMATGGMGSRALYDEHDLLQRLNLTRAGQLTNGAAVLFARDSLAWSPNLAIRIVSFVSDKSADIANDTLISGPAVRCFNEAVTKIQQLTGHSGRFEDDSVQRVDVPAYSLYALREGLVNAIVHRDYTLIGGKIHVEIYPDYLIIQNPGRLPDGWKVADLKQKHGSVPFNPDIARVFHLRKLMEQLGIGTQKVVEECRKLGADPPKWSDARGTVALTLFAAPEPVVTYKLNDRQKAFLKYANSAITYKSSDYAEFNGVVARQARRELVELVDLGFLERTGRGPATVYARTEKEV